MPLDSYMNVTQVTLQRENGEIIKEVIFVSTFVKCRKALVNIMVFNRNLPVINQKKIMTINIFSDLKDLLTKKRVTNLFN